MKFQNVRVYGFADALRGMRNPLESWRKSDSIFSHSLDWVDVQRCALGYLQALSEIGIENKEELFSSYINWLAHQQVGDELSTCTLIGPNDLKLACRLIKGGSEHRKFLRQIFVTVDITAPLYWWKEFDTYKVGTVANSTSTMHKLASTPITLDCFEVDDYENIEIDGGEVNSIITYCESLRKQYLETSDKKYWKELIRWLPESWLQTRTVSMNYENLLSICSQRRHHKLNEWSGADNPALPNFIDFARSLPYAQQFLFLDELKDCIYPFT